MTLIRSPSPACGGGAAVLSILYHSRSFLRGVCWRQILLNIEHRLMSQATQPCKYDPLTVMQKVEVFEMALQHTAGQDISKVRSLFSATLDPLLRKYSNEFGATRKRRLKLSQAPFLCGFAHFEDEAKRRK